MKSPVPLILEASGVHKRFDGRTVLNGVDLIVPRGAVVCVLGRSGTGKSVLLKCLGGLLTPDAGVINFVGGAHMGLPTRGAGESRLRSSFLFQQNALFDSITAMENVELPLEQTTKLSRGEITQRAREILQRLDLAEFGDYYPGELSGGMQKRLALARAVVTEPQLVLFDEPTAGLDPLNRKKVFEMIERYRHELDFTAVVVTHDIAEALIACDSVAVIESGLTRFQGTPAEFYASDDCLLREFRENLVALNERLVASGRRSSWESQQTL